MRLSTKLCVSFSIRSNNYNSFISCLHFYNISVKSATCSSTYLSTLLHHLRQVSPRFFRLSVYTFTTSPSSQPSVFPALYLHFYNISVKSATGSFISLSTLHTTSSNRPSLVFRQHVTSQALGYSQLHISLPLVSPSRSSFGLGPVHLYATTFF